MYSYHTNKRVLWLCLYFILEWIYGSRLMLRICFHHHLRKVQRKTPMTKPTNANEEVFELSNEEVNGPANGPANGLTNVPANDTFDYFEHEIDASIEAIVASVEDEYQITQASQIVNPTQASQAATKSPKKKERVFTKKKKVVS